MSNGEREERCRDGRLKSMPEPSHVLEPDFCLREFVQAIFNQERQFWLGTVSNTIGRGR